MENKKIILNFSPSGVIPSKAMTPHVPVTPEEIIELYRKLSAAFENTISKLFYACQPADEPSVNLSNGHRALIWKMH